MNSTYPRETAKSQDFCVSYQDGITSFTNMLFSCLVTLAAGAFVLSLQSPLIGESKIFFAAWLVISLLVTVAIWFKHHRIIERMLLDPKLHDFNNQFDQIQPLSV